MNAWAVNDRNPTDQNVPCDFGFWSLDRKHCHVLTWVILWRPFQRNLLWFPMKCSLSFRCIAKALGLWSSQGQRTCFLLLSSLNIACTQSALCKAAVKLSVACMVVWDNKDLPCFHRLAFSSCYEMLSALRSRWGLTQLSRHFHGALNSAEHLMGSQHISVELNSPLRWPIYSRLSLMKRTNGDKCQVPVSQQSGVSLRKVVGDVFWHFGRSRGDSWYDAEVSFEGFLQRNEPVPLLLKMPNEAWHKTWAHILCVCVQTMCPL